MTANEVRKEKATVEIVIDAVDKIVRVQLRLKPLKICSKMYVDQKN